MRSAQEEELVTVVADYGLEDMTAHFMPRRRYIWDRLWKWQMRREERQVKGRGYYVLGTSRHTFFNAGVREARIRTDLCMVLVVPQGEVSHKTALTNNRGNDGRLGLRWCDH